MFQSAQKSDSKQKKDNSSGKENGSRLDPSVYFHVPDLTYGAAEVAQLKEEEELQKKEAKTPVAQKMVEEEEEKAVQGKSVQGQGKGIPVNDNPSLENEADVMGKKVAEGSSTLSNTSTLDNVNSTLNGNIQYKIVQQKSPEPELSRKDKKKYNYGVINGNIFTDSSGNVINSSDTTGKGVEMDDVEQGAIGDCYFLAAIAAIAKSDPASLKKLIKDNGDGTVDVTLHVKKHFYSRKKTPHVETVSLNFPLDSSGTPAYAQLGNNKELWVMILEKAFAQYSGGYKKISGGYPGKAMETLSGGKSKSYLTFFRKEEKIIELIKDALDNNKAVTASSKHGNEKKATKAGIVTGHAYTVKSINKSKKTITLYNPWGTKHVNDLPISDFKKFYRSFQILN